MKQLFYALLLLAVVTGSILFLRSLEPEPRTATRERGDARLGARPRPVVQSEAPPETARPGKTENASSAERLAAGVELLGLWHVREAAAQFEGAVAGDSSNTGAWVRLVECDSDPLVCREDAARAAWEHAAGSAAPEDSSFLNGVKSLFLHRDYDRAVDDFTRARKRRGGELADLRYYLALAKYRAGRLDAADKDLGDLLTEDDTVGRVLELSIRVMVARGDLDGAARRAHDLARIYAEEPFPYVLLAQIEMRRGAFDTAGEFCNNALLLDARYVPAIVTRANLYAAVRDMEAARVSFEKLLLFDDPILRATGQDGIAFVEFYSGHFGDGVAAMDEAIRDAVMAGSARRALSYASSLVAMLCELGQADEAEGVIDRWVSGFGEVPQQLARMRVDILRGDIGDAHSALIELKTRRSWLIWSRVMGLEYAEVAALTDIAGGRFDHAITMVDSSTATVAGVGTRRAFLRGYASFESGDAEAARTAFLRAGAALFGVEFPYRGDPVLGVQSLFYIAEASLASGDAKEARRYYTDFLSRWEGADWDLPAVKRAKEKLASLPLPAKPAE